MVLPLLSLAVFEAKTSRQCNEQHWHPQSNDTITEKVTPVYEGDQNHQVAVLEIDYPKIAVNFSKTFPLADKQLWLTDGSHLFVNFLNKNDKVSAVFTVKGKMNYAISIIGMPDVPENLICQIKNDYPLLSFLHARKIQADGYTTYELVFENCHEFITFSNTDDNEIVVTDKMLKNTADKKCGCKIH